MMLRCIGFALVLMTFMPSIAQFSGDLTQFEAPGKKPAARNPVNPSGFAADDNRVTESNIAGTWNCKLMPEASYKVQVQLNKSGVVDFGTTKSQWQLLEQSGLNLDASFEQADFRFARVAHWTITKDAFNQQHLTNQDSRVLSYDAKAFFPPEAGDNRNMDIELDEQDERSVIGFLFLSCSRSAAMKARTATLSTQESAGNPIATSKEAAKRANPSEDTSKPRKATFGAIALGSGQAVGITVGQPLRNDAVRVSMSLCSKSGNNDTTLASCIVASIFQNSCASHARDQSYHSTIVGWATAPNPRLEEAHKLALARCAAKGGKRCFVDASACDNGKLDAPDESDGSVR